MAELRARISASEQTIQKFDLETFELRKLNEIEVKEQYHL
jgi:hypothetical protein